MATRVFGKAAPAAVVESVTDLISAVGKLRSVGATFNAFRGQRNAEWSPEPGILRSPRKLLDHERDIVREIVSIHPHEFRDDSSMLDRLVRMQHFGLPTRLLDVTLNPLVALYFATEPYRSNTRTVDGGIDVYSVPAKYRKYYDSDTLACIANLANLSSEEKQEIISCGIHDIETFNKDIKPINRLVQFVRSERPHFHSEIEPSDLFFPYFAVPKMNNRRIIAQSGAFLIFGLDIGPKTPRWRRRHPITRQRIEVPERAKLYIRKELENIGINESTLFPELDRAASYIVRRFS